MNTLDFFLLNWSDVPMLRAGSISSAEINTATRHTRSPQADHLQDQAQRKQAVLRRCSAEGTQASSSSTARIPAATHTAALMQRGHLAAPPVLPTSTAHLPRPDLCSCPTLLAHTQTAGTLLTLRSRAAPCRWGKGTAVLDSRAFHEMTNKPVLSILSSNAPFCQFQILPYKQDVTFTSFTV